MSFASESKKATLFESEPIGVPEAAALLGLSDTRVRQLIHQGALPAQRVSGRWIIRASDTTSLRRRRTRGRPLSPRMAWGLLVLCEGGQAEWLNPVERSRLRARLRAHPPVSEIAALCRHRAAVRSFHGHRSVLPRVLKHPNAVGTGASAPGHDVLDLGLVEVYVRPRDLRSLVRDLGLERLEVAHGANVVIRVPSDGLWPFITAQAGHATVALDLWDAGDARSHRAAVRLWGRVLADAKWEPRRHGQ